MNDDDLLASLRRLGADHEPDSEAIWARVDPARADAREARDDVPVVSLDSRRDRDLRARQGGAPRSRPRPAALVPLAAAAVLGVLVVSQVVTRDGDVATAPAVTPTVAPAPATTVPPRPVPSTPTTSAPDAVGTPVATTARTRTRTVTVTVPADGPGTPSVPGSGGRPTSTSAVADLGVPAPSIVPLLGPARGLVLSTSQVDDWVVVGARTDGVQVRAKRPVYPQAPLVVVPPDAATVVRSPLAVSWGDGLPEQSRIGATTWLAGGSGGAWTVTTERLDVPRRLRITGGGAPSGLRLDVVAPGRRGSWTWSGNPAGSGPFTLSVDIPGGAGPVTVTLTPLGGDRLALAAVSATRI